MSYPGDLLDHHRWRVERRGDGALLVRVTCQSRYGEGLPDAVFTFRSGDPQYGYWEARCPEEMRG